MSADAAFPFTANDTLDRGSVDVQGGSTPSVTDSGVFSTQPTLTSSLSDGVSINGSVTCAIPTDDDPNDVIINVNGDADSPPSAPNTVPETPLAAALPFSAAATLGVSFLWRRRRHTSLG